MTRDELVAQCRLRSDDLFAPFLWTDEEWVMYLTEAEREACIRARLIEDADSAATTIDVEPGVMRYPLHPAVLDVLRLEFERLPGRPVNGWDLNETDLLISVTQPETALLTVIRLPLYDVMPESGPEIRSAHHYKLVDWALRCAYLKQDADAFDRVKAMEYEALFQQSFGAPITANVMRKHRRKSPRVTRPISF